MKTNTLDFDAKALREKILNLAIRGKLVKQDSNDESATVLLKKIKLEKQKLIKEKKIRKSKSLKAITSKEKPFDIPDSWEWVKFGEIVQFSLGKTPSRGMTEYWNNGTIPWVSIGDIKNEKYLKETKEKISESALDDKFKNELVPANTLLMSFKLSIGKVCILKVPAVHNEAIISIHPFINTNYITRDYLYYVLPLISNMGEFTPAIKGKTLNKTLLQELKIPLPPLEEQSRIAAKIAQLFALLRKVEYSTQQYAKLQTLLKSKVLDLAMCGKLVEQDPNDEAASVLLEKIKAEKEQLIKEKKIKKSKTLPPISDEEKLFEIPDSWEWVRLGDLTKKVGAGNTPKGGSKSDVYVTEGIKFIREMNVYNDGLHLKGITYIRPKLAEKRTGSAVIAKDILLNITGGSLGRSALMSDDFDLGNVNQHVLIIRNVDSKVRYFMHLFLISSLAQKSIHNKSVGDKAGFSATKTKELLMPFPPIKEQKRIAKKVEEVFRIISEGYIDRK